MKTKQIGAIPLKRDEDGEIRVLLVTSRETSRWVIPKGWPMKDLSDREAAETEAREEAGIEGRLHRKPIGEYSYFKRRQAHFDLIEVKVYALLVEQELEDWPERAERTRRWFALEEAARKVVEPGLAALIRSLTSMKLL